MDGKKIKALNQWYNKENSRLQSIKNRQGIPGITERQARLILKCNNRVRNYLNQVARYIINYCQTHQIGKLIVGYNPTVKQEIKIGSRNNQNFVQIPHYSLTAKLKALCFRYAIRYLRRNPILVKQAFLMVMIYLATMPIIPKNTHSMANGLNVVCIEVGMEI